VRPSRSNPICRKYDGSFTGAAFGRVVQRQVEIDGGFLGVFFVAELWK
jgi:hypothetical protein